MRSIQSALVTGISGFCGGYLATWLLGCGLRVVGCDVASAIKLSIAPIPDRVDLRLVDVRDRDQLQQLLAETQPDQIYHLAGLTRQVTDLELKTLYEVNIQGTINLLEGVRSVRQSCGILIAGSGALYGQVMSGENPIREIQPFRPVTHYAITKATQDLLGFHYWAAAGLHVIRARTFNIIGPHQSPQFVASAFAKQIAEIEAGQKPPVLSVGNLKAERDFVDVRDVVRAYQLLLENGEAGQAYNVCSGQAESIRGLLEQLLALSTVREIEIRQDSARMQAADVPVQIGDYSKLFQRTGWQPSITLNQSLRDLLDCWRLRVKEGD